MPRFFMTNFSKRWSKLKILITTLFILSIAMLTAFTWLQTQLEKPLKIPEPTFFKVEKGASINKVCRQFTQLNWLESCIPLKVMSKLDTSFDNIKSGTYKLDGTDSVSQIVQMFSKGEVHQFAFTIVDGENIYQVLDKLADVDFLSNDIRDLDLQGLANSIGLKSDTPEGFLAPDTYFVEADTKITDLLKRAVKKQQERIEQVWSQRRVFRFKTPYELLKLASIIEKESAVASERGAIASVFYNRLDKGMRLQTDPTVIYGIWQEYDGDIKRVHLKQKTPYNTYRINGLPPTPIANPSLGSLLAAAQPEQTDFLYFVASGSGGHVFSKTLAEHNKAVRSYLAIQKLKNKE